MFRRRIFLPNIVIILTLLFSFLSITPVGAAGLAVSSATPNSTGVLITSQIEITFNQAIHPDTFSGTINGDSIVPTQIVIDPSNTIVTVDPGELEYARIYDVVVDSTVLDLDDDPLGSDYAFSFTVQDNPNPKRPSTTVVLPAGPFEVGQTYIINGQAAGYVWERDTDNPLELRHWDSAGSDIGSGPMLHPTALYFPGGFDGYDYYLYYTPYPPGTNENPVLMRSNDGVNFVDTGVPQNPLFTYNYQPPYDMQNLADPEVYRLGDTWMLIYEMETPSGTASAIGPWMTGGGYIGVALSDDGVNWEPYGGPYTYDPGTPPTGFPSDGNPVIYPELSNWYENSSSAKTGEMGVFFKDGQYHLYRTVIGAGLYIAYDTALDPRGPWNKQGVALDLGTYSVGPHPDVVYDAERDIYTMLYLIPNGADAWQLGIQTADDPAGPWTAHPLNPIFSAQGGWEGSQLYRATMVNVDGQWYMYYSGNSSYWQIGLAREVPGIRQVEVSTNGGTSWQLASANPDGSWSYNWTPTEDGAHTITARVTDDFIQGDPTAGSDLVVGPAPLQTPENPILIVQDSVYSANPFSRYLAEIMRAEGLVEIQQAELSVLVADADSLSYLNNFQLVILGETDLDTTGEQLFRDYVNGGGNLIAMRPDTDLADLFGLTYAGIRTEDFLQFYAFDTLSEPGTGIVDVSLQYHGEADNYTLNGATSLADLWDDIDTSSTNPAVSFNAYGSGQAAAFTFDLAQSIVLMRQGNPDWKDSEGDGLAGYRPSDMFARSTGERWLAGERTRIPQADEQQRFLANLILSMINQPLPRMWYLPDANKALMINTGDAEGLGGSSLNQINDDAASYGGFFTHYLMESGISSTDAATEAGWRASGHEVGPHVYGGGSETCTALYPAYQTIVNNIQTKFSHGARSARSHTIDWCGWSDMAGIEAEFGTGMDTNYYHYTPWLLSFGDNANGYFTGSGLPQKFSAEDGGILPIYQALTEWPDEWFDDNGLSANDTAQIIQDMFTAAENGFYSAFVANIHPVRYYNTGGDITYDWTHQVWAYAQANGIPMWTAEMLLDFVLARDGARFDNINWNGTNLIFDFSSPFSGQDLTLMVPAQAQGGSLLSIEVDGSPITYNTETIKGRDYAMFTTTSTSAHVIANYGVDTTAPVISNVQTQFITDSSAVVTWTTDEPATSLVEYGTDPGSLLLSETAAGHVTSHSLSLTGLNPTTTYYYQVTSLDHAGNPASSSVLDFTTGLPRWIETSTSDFSDGVFTNTQVINSGDGAIILGLSTGFYDHFEGTELNATDWLSRNIISQPISVTVDTSWATVDNGTYIRTNDTWFQETVEALVTLSDGPNAHFGWATTVQGGDDGIDDPHWMIFTAQNGGILARTRLDDGQGTNGEINTLLSGILPGVPHNFKIVWNPDDSIEFWVDGYLEATHNRAFTEQMRVYLSSNSGQTGSADWVSVSGAYSMGGVYESSVFDSGGTADFDALSWTGSTPTSTAVSFDTRSSVNGINWSSWEAIGPADPIASPEGQYLQYRATLSTSDQALTPQVDEVVATYQPGPDTTPPVVNNTIPSDLSIEIPVDSDITINYNEPINPSTFSATLNGVLIPSNEITYHNGGITVLINPSVNLEFNTVFSVEIASGVEDLAGNPTLGTVNFAFTTAEQIDTWIETTTADFLDGTLINTQVTSIGDGEFQLSQSFFDHFLGTELDLIKWSTGDWGGGAVSTVVNDSIVTISSGDFIASEPTFTESVVEGMVRYDSAGISQNFGVGDGLNAPCTFMVIGPASAAGQMRVQTYDNDGATIHTNQTTFLPAFDSIIGDGLFHYLKVEWTGTEVRYYIGDPDTPVATHTSFGRPLDAAYNIWLSSGANDLSADWIGVQEYAASGSYESNVFDSLGVSEFRSLTWIGSQPTNTTVSFETRSSNDNVTWTSWQAVSGGGDIASPVGRYVQYRALLATTDPSATPVIEEVSVSYVPGVDTTPPLVLTTDPADQATDVALDSSITITYNESINPATFSASISGGILINTSFFNDDTTVVLDPDTDLASLTSYTVEIASGVEDLAGNPTTTPYSFDFTTIEQLFGWSQTTTGDFEGGTLDGLVVSEDGNGELRLPPALYDRFLGSSLDGGQWTSGIYGGGAYTPLVANGVMTHTNPGGGAYVRSIMTFEPSTTLEGRIKFSKGGSPTAPNAYFGLAGDGLVPWALIGTGYDGDSIYASVYPDSGPYTYDLGDLFDEWHDYRIVWNASNVEFWVDGVYQHTELVSPTGPLTVYLSVSGSTPAGASVTADWIRVEEYGTSSETLVEVLNDSFPEADGPANNWESIGNPDSAGDWTVAEHEFVHNLTGSSYHPAVLNNTFPAYSNFVLETRAMSTAASGLYGLVWGLQDNAHYYFAQFYPGQGIRVFRVDYWPPTSVNLIASAPSAPVPVQNQWVTLRLEGKDGIYDIYVNDNLELTVSDGTYPSGRIGILGYGTIETHYDDIVVSEIQTQVVPVDPGMYTSSVFDAGAEMEWKDLSWSGSQPADTSVSYETRTGNILPPDGTWSDWQTVNSPISSPYGRYFQYRTTLATTDIKASPVVEDVTVTYGFVPTGVQLPFLSAEYQDGAIFLTWETTNEIDLLGFNLFRSDGSTLDQVNLNTDMIQALSPGSPGGNIYSYQDRSVEMGKEYSYWLEVVTGSGTTTIGPVTVTASYLLYTPMLIR